MMKRFIPALLIVHILFLQQAAIATDAVPTERTPARIGLNRRPVEHWLETVRQEDPDEFKRLKDLRENDPEAFASDLRKRMQAKVVERVIEQNHPLRVLIESLPSAQRQTLMDTFHQLAEGEKALTGRRGPRPDPMPPPRHDPQEAGDETTPDAAKPRTRAELEAAYDRRTQMIEKTIDRIHRQLEGLERMLDERKNRREEIINRQRRP